MRNKTWISGHVHWFDKLSGEGVIKDDLGNSYFVHEWAVIGSDTLRDKAPVKFQLVRDTTFVQVSAIMEVSHEIFFNSKRVQTS